MNKDFELLDSAVNVVKNLNYTVHAQQLSIPIFKGFEIIDSNNPQVVLCAKGEDILEQIISDGQLRQNETLDQRIEQVITQTKEYMKDNGYESNEETCSFMNDYSNNIFDFKIYIQSIIIPSNNKKINLRQIIAFFVEKNENDVYQISLSTETHQDTNQPSDLKNDYTSKKLEIMLKTLLDNIKYKN